MKESKKESSKCVYGSFISCGLQKSKYNIMCLCVAHYHEGQIKGTVSLGIQISLPSSPISGWAPRWWLQTPWFCLPPPDSSGHSSQPAPPEPGAPPSPRPWRPRSPPAGGWALLEGSRGRGERMLGAKGIREKCNSFNTFQMHSGCRNYAVLVALGMSKKLEIIK